MGELDARLAVVEHALTLLTDEWERARTRLHRIETDRANLRLLADNIRRLEQQMSELAGSLESVAEDAADRAVRKALEGRASYRLRLFGELVGLAGLLVAVVALVVTNL